MTAEDFAKSVEHKHSKATARAFNPGSLMPWVEAIMDLVAVCQKTPKEYKEIAAKPNMVQRIRIRRALATHFPNETRDELNARANALCLTASEVDEKTLQAMEKELEF